MQNGIVTLKNSLEVAYHIKQIPYDPAIPLLSIYSGELKTYIHTKACTKMLIAALVKIAKM